MSQRGRDTNQGPPRWVKMSGAAAIVLAALIPVLIFTGIGGNHGPWRHLPSAAVPGNDASTKGAGG